MCTPISIFCSVLTLPVITEPSFAYLGPGIGAGAIAIVLGFVASIFLALFAIVWYPIKRLRKKLTRKGTDSDNAQES